MGKHIIELPDDEHLISWWTYIGTEDGKQHIDFHEVVKTPYKEPDPEAIKQEAYQKGLKDAWKAARKIACDRAHGGFRIGTKQHIFGAADCAYILANYNASEAVERIRQHEQKQEEQIQVGDEVMFYNGEKCIVTVVGDGQAAEVMDKGGFSMRMDDGLRNSMKKTGRHFSEIAEVLKKMQEEMA